MNELANTAHGARMHFFHSITCQSQNKLQLGEHARQVEARAGQGPSDREVDRKVDQALAPVVNSGFRILGGNRGQKTKQRV